MGYRNAKLRGKAKDNLINLGVKIELVECASLYTQFERP